MLPLLLVIAWWAADPPPVAVIPETASQLIDDWPEDGLRCNFWNSSTRYKGTLCSHFSIARLVSTVADESLVRALKCGAEHEVDCILAPEVGINLPASFVYDDEEGFKMLVAPKILSASNERRVGMINPITEESSEVAFNSSIHVEYLPAHSRAPVSAKLDGIAAYCVQMLRMAFSTGCWDALD
jgi:hypothetical protein